ncbi:MAG: SPOR domain-containing protein [Pseudomonadota bacterium]
MSGDTWRDDDRDGEDDAMRRALFSLRDRTPSSREEGRPEGRELPRRLSRRPAATTGRTQDIQAIAVALSLAAGLAAGWSGALFLGGATAERTAEAPASGTNLAAMEAAEIRIDALRSELVAVTAERDAALDELTQTMSAFGSYLALFEEREGSDLVPLDPVAVPETSLPLSVGEEAATALSGSPGPDAAERVTATSVAAATGPEPEDGAPLPLIYTLLPEGAQSGAPAPITVPIPRDTADGLTEASEPARPEIAMDDFVVALTGIVLHGASALPKDTSAPGSSPEIARDLVAELGRPTKPRPAGPMRFYGGLQPTITATDAARPSGNRALTLDALLDQGQIEAVPTSSITGRSVQEGKTLSGLILLPDDQGETAPTVLEVRDGGSGADRTGGPENPGGQPTGDAMPLSADKPKIEAAALRSAPTLDAFGDLTQPLVPSDTPADTVSERADGPGHTGSDVLADDGPEILFDGEITGIQPVPRARPAHMVAAIDAKAVAVTGVRTTVDVDAANSLETTALPAPVTPAEAPATTSAEGAETPVAETVPDPAPEPTEVQTASVAPSAAPAVPSEVATGEPAAQGPPPSLYLQAGIFREAERATRLKDSLNARGVGADLLPFTLKSGPATRVRVGPFQNAAERNAARIMLVEFGISDAIPVKR